MKKKDLRKQQSSVKSPLYAKVYFNIFCKKTYRDNSG